MPTWTKTKMNSASPAYPVFGETELRRPDPQGRKAQIKGSPCGERRGRHLIFGNCPQHQACDPTVSTLPKKEILSPTQVPGRATVRSSDRNIKKSSEIPQILYI